MKLHGTNHRHDWSVFEACAILDSGPNGSWTCLALSMIWAWTLGCIGLCGFGFGMSPRCCQVCQISDILCLRYSHASIIQSNVILSFFIMPYPCCFCWILLDNCRAIHILCNYIICATSYLLIVITGNTRTKDQLREVFLASRRFGAPVAWWHREGLDSWTVKNNHI